MHRAGRPLMDELTVRTLKVLHTLVLEDHRTAWRFGIMVDGVIIDCMLVDLRPG